MMIAKKETTPYWELIVSTQDGNQKYLSFDTKEEAEKYCIDNGWEPLGITKVVFCEKTSLEGPLIERTTYFGKWGSRTVYLKLLPNGEAFYNCKTGEWERIGDGFSDLARIYYQVFGSKIILPLPPKSRLIFTSGNWEAYIFSQEAIEYIKNKYQHKDIVIVEYYPKYDEFTNVLRMSVYGDINPIASYTLFAKDTKFRRCWFDWFYHYSVDYQMPSLYGGGYIWPYVPEKIYNAFKGKTPCLSIEDGKVNEVYFQANISRNKKRIREKLPTPIFTLKD